MSSSLRTRRNYAGRGLLQTEEYARAVYQGSGQFTGGELEQLVAARMDRQEIFARPRPPRCVFVIDEYVLRRPIGGPVVMRAQLEHLVAMIEQPTFRIQVVPTSTGAYTGLDGAFTIATVATVGQDVAYLENRLRGTYIEEPDDVASLRTAWETVRADALSPQRTEALIKELVQTWT